MSKPIRLNIFSYELSLIGIFLGDVPGTIVFAPGSLVFAPGSFGMVHLGGPSMGD